MCTRVAMNAISVMGGNGYMHDYPLERLLRDSRITTIYEGTTQLQVLAAVRGVSSGSAVRAVRLAHCEIEVTLLVLWLCSLAMPEISSRGPTA